MPDNKERGLYNKYEVKRTDGKPVKDSVVLEFDDPIAQVGIAYWARTMREEGYEKVYEDVCQKLGRRAVPKQTPKPGFILIVQETYVIKGRGVSLESLLIWGTMPGSWPGPDGKTLLTFDLKDSSLIALPVKGVETFCSYIGRDKTAPMDHIGLHVEQRFADTILKRRDDWKGVVCLG